MDPLAHNPCRTCGACCRSSLVPASGYDVWRIATRYHLDPRQFLIAYPQTRLGLGGFRLSRDRPPYLLALDKQGRLRPTAPCVFLLRLEGGHDRCAIYPDRPATCQSYPMALLAGEPRQRDDALCAPGAWPPAIVHQPRWRQALQRLRLRFDVYYEVVARWNAHLGAEVDAEGVSLSQYYSYLLNVYQALAALDATQDPRYLAAVEAAWPAAGSEGERQDLGERQRVCLDYLLQARRVIDHFFPVVAPLPSVVPWARALLAQDAASGAKAERGP